MLYYADALTEIAFVVPSPVESLSKSVLCMLFRGEKKKNFFLFRELYQKQIPNKQTSGVNSKTLARKILIL